MSEIILNASSNFNSFFKNLQESQTELQATTADSVKLQTTIDKTFNDGAKSVKNYNDVIGNTQKRIEELNRKLLANPGDKSIKAAIQFNKEYIQSIKQLTGEKDKDIAKNVQTINSLRGLQQEYKRLVGLSLELQNTDPLKAQDFLKQAGLIKDQIADIRLQTKNLGSDTATFDALSQGAQTVASSFQVAQGAAALFGEENEDLQKQLVQLNAIMAVTNGLQNIGNALQAQSALRLGIARVAASGYTVAMRILGQTTTGAAAQTRAFNAALSANAVGAVLLATTTIITFRKEIFEFFTDLPRRFGVLGRVFQALLIVISGPLAPLTALILLFDRLFSSGKKATESIVDQMNKVSEATQQAADDQIKSISRRYDTEIALQQALGKSTLALEKVKQEAILSTLKIQERQISLQIAMIDDIAIYTKGLADSLKALQEDLKSVQDEILDTEAEITVNQLQQDVERRESAKEALDARKQAYQQAADAILAIIKRASDAELSLLTGQDRIDAIRSRNTQELDAIKRQFEESNAIIAKASKDQALMELVLRGELTRDQYEALRLIMLEMESKLADEELALARTKQQAQIDLMAEGTAKEIEELKVRFAARQQEIIKLFGIESAEYAAFIEQRDKAVLDAETAGSIDQIKLRTDIGLREIELLKAQGLTEEDLVKLKEEKKLQLIISGAQQQIAVLQAAATASGGLTDELKKQILDLEIVIQDSQSKLAKTAENNKIDIMGAIFPGLDESQLDAVKNAVKQTYDAIVGIISDAIDQQIEQNQRYIDSLNQRIDETQDAIENEQKLFDQGKASNLDAEKKNQAALKAEREKALKEQKKLQEQKNAIETVNQVISLISASAAIFSSFAALPFGIGIPIAIGVIAAMFAAFAATKIQAANAASSGFKDGVIDLKGPGTSKSDSISAKLSRGESVMTAEETQNHYGLFKAIRSGKQREIHGEMLRELLKNTGVYSPNFKELDRVKAEFGQHQADKIIYAGSDSKRTNQELREIKEILSGKVESDKNKPVVIGDSVIKGNNKIKSR